MILSPYGVHAAKLAIGLVGLGRFQLWTPTTGGVLGRSRVQVGEMRAAKNVACEGAHSPYAAVQPDRAVGYGGREHRARIESGAADGGAGDQRTTWR